MAHKVLFVALDQRDIITTSVMTWLNSPSFMNSITGLHSSVKLSHLLSILPTGTVSFTLLL